MIPTIEQIIALLLAKTYTEEQAIDYLYQHIYEVRERNDVAAFAMQGMLANSTLGKTGEEIIRMSYEAADLLIAEGKKERTK